MSAQIAVFTIYETRASVETAADALVEEGFSSSDISVLLPDNSLGNDAATVLASKSHQENIGTAPSHGIVRGTLGVLAGLSMLAIPGLGPLVGEGTLKAGLAGLGMRRAVGEIANSLINIGVPELEAKRYEDRLQRRAILLSVRCGTLDEAKRATDTIKRTGGADVCTTAQNPAAAISDPGIASKAARRSGGAENS
jgi:hypothetical protein